MSKRLALFSLFFRLKRNTFFDVLIFFKTFYLEITDSQKYYKDLSFTIYTDSPKC